MSAVTPSPDRRVRRSEDVQTALAYQLVATARRAVFDAVVLADENGLVMARAGAPSICEQVAAMSPVLAPEMKVWHGAVGTCAGRRTQLSVAPLEIEGQRLYISALAGRRKDITRALFLGGRGVSRILQ